MEDADQFIFNKEFKHKLCRIKINQVQLKETVRRVVCVDGCVDVGVGCVDVGVGCVDVGVGCVDVGVAYMYVDVRRGVCGDVNG